MNFLQRGGRTTTSTSFARQHVRSMMALVPPPTESKRRTSGKTGFVPELRHLDPNKPHIFKRPVVLGHMFRPRRTGVIAMKVGMMPGWDIYGSRKPLTVFKLEDVQVVQVKTEEKEGHNSLQIGAGPVKEKRVKSSLKGHFKSAEVPLKKHLKEFQVAPEGLLPVGTKLTCRHFVPGQFVDVQGTTIGKGFQGGMKRHGFKGQPASHGVSKAHRKMGSNGPTDPGRVFKGKKMPGRMGGKTKTVQNLVVFKIDVERDLVYLQGCVPGHKGEYVSITDAKKNPDYLYNGQPLHLPWPTYVPKDDAEEVFEQVIYAPIPHQNVLDPLNALDPDDASVEHPKPML